MLIAAAEAGDANAVLKAIDCARAYKRLANDRQFRAVEQLDAETSAVLVHWPSQTAAAADLGIDAKDISRACRDIWRTAGGFAWRFAATAETILDGDGEPWVCCDSCDKWRRIARIEDLPDQWYCWLLPGGSCDEPEDAEVTSHQPADDEELSEYELQVRENENIVAAALARLIDFF